MSPGRFSGHTVLVTGATSGIGLAGARRIAYEGGSLILAGHTPSRIETLRAEFPEAVFIGGDAASPGLAHALAEAAADGLDGLWLNAGIADLHAIEETTAEEFERTMAVNVRAPFQQLAALSPLLRQGASVVLTSSTSAYEGAAATSLYAASKGALVAAARSWARELAPRSIRVNTLVPGTIDTDFRRFLDDEHRSQFEAAVIARTPLGRAGTPDEAAAVALFLLSDDAAYVTGAQYVVDGGLTLH